jgi:serine/threonine protein kinase
MTDRIGQRFGYYRVTKLLWEDGFAQVYEGQHVFVGTQAAIKLPAQPTAFDTESSKYFAAEMRVLAPFNHPYIARILDAGVERMTPYLVMDYPAGGTLQTKHPQGAILPLPLILRYVQQAASALQYAHAQGVVHRDVKPQNVWLGATNDILLSGFDLASINASSSSHDDHFAGRAVAYIAPEQCMGRPRRASDQYALALMVYEWLTGELPFSGAVGDILSSKVLKPVPPLHKKVPGIAPEIEAVVLKALEIQPEARFPSVQAFAKAFEQACGPHLAPTPHVVPGGRFGNYSLMRFLDGGYFAEVWLGVHVGGEWQAAIKILRARPTLEEQELFRQEAKTVAALVHPNIVRLLEFGMEGTIPFLVMDHAPNGSLRTCHPEGMPLPLDLVRVYVRQVAAALQHAHDHHVLHRDVKPANMLLGRNHEVLLSDFGIAIGTPSRSPGPQDAAGTLAYMAPEQFHGLAVRATDQYALGITVYEWLTGMRPFRGTPDEITGQQLRNAPRPLREHLPTLSPLVEEVVLISLAKDPMQRFGSMRAFANAFEQACWS